MSVTIVIIQRKTKQNVKIVFNWKQKQKTKENTRIKPNSMYNYFFQILRINHKQHISWKKTNWVSFFYSLSS